MGQPSVGRVIAGALGFVLGLVWMPIQLLLDILKLIPWEVVLYSVFLGTGIGSISIYLYIRYLSILDLSLLSASSTFLATAVVVLQVNAALPSSGAIGTAYTAIYANLSTLHTLCRNMHVTIKDTFPELDLAVESKMTAWPSQEKDELYQALGNGGALDRALPFLNNIDINLDICAMNRAVPFPPQLRALTVIFVACYNGIVMPWAFYNVVGWAAVIVNTILTMGMVGLIHAATEAADPLRHHVRARRDRLRFNAARSTAKGDTLFEGITETRS